MPTKAKRTGHATRTSFKKGDRANPLGRPVTELSFTAQFKRKLAEQYTGEEYTEAVSNIEAMTDDFMKQYWLAKTVQDKAVVLDRFADRTEGKPQQKVDHTTKGDKIIPILGGLSIDE